MENEIKVGELVRTRNKGIQKIAYLRPNATVNKYAYFIGYDDDGDRLNGILKTTDILKHSFYKIDLVECGDYVNGMLVVNIVQFSDEINSCFKQILVNRDKDCTLPPLRISEEDIKTIVTKEQFESISYKVKQEEN